MRDPEFRGDWHSAHDTVEELRLMASNENAIDLVFASGKLISVSEIIHNYFAVYLPNRPLRIIPTKMSNYPKNQLSVVGYIGLAENLGWKPRDTLTNI